MPFAILLWLAGDRFLPRCFARLSLPQFANVAFAVLVMANLPWCAIGLPMTKCSTFVREKADSLFICFHNLHGWKYVMGRRNFLTHRSVIWDSIQCLINLNVTRTSSVAKTVKIPKLNIAGNGN